MEEYKLIVDSQYGYKKIVVEDEQAFNDFYRDDYYKKWHQRQKEKIEKSISLKEKGEQDYASWMENTYYVDVLEMINSNTENMCKELLDIGCGVGKFIKWMTDNGWKCKGIEPSREATQIATENKQDVFNGTLEEYILKEDKLFSVVTMHNVLEHIPNPEKTLDLVKQLLNTKGILLIRVPNDFNKLQMDINEIIVNKYWWTKEVGHVNFFSFESLEKLLDDKGFDIIYKTCDFPMELFVLMGDNYIDNQTLGKECHKRRMNFELNINGELKKKIYDKLASIGLGRNIIIYAKKR